VSAQSITPGHLTSGVPAVRRGRLRSAALAAGVAAVLAAGGYGLVQALEPDSTARPVAAPVTRDDARAIQELRESLERQYRSTPAPAAAPSAEKLREIRDSLAAQYGGGREPGPTGGDR
jgi:hypothetical protein